ncbi:MAG: lycopene cyclase [Loktanella sp.]|nr:lycopene cyclase [Loktanella sp.]
MPHADFDIAIMGGGCAGLSIATRLASAGRNLCVIEPRTAYHDDRAWSFWRTAPDPFEDCVRATWQGWDIGGPSGIVHRESARLRYQSVSAGAFYDRAQSVISDHPDAQLLLGQSAHSVNRAGSIWEIGTQDDIITANHVIDARSPSRIPTYGQFFLGWEIQAQNAVFDPDRVQLMQFRKARSKGVDFVYILPFARDRALVEVTSFAPESLGQDIFKTWLETEITALDTGGFTILREESGALPMEVGYREPHYEGLIRMGLSGGAARPSTGYAFARIQAQADHVAHAFRRGTRPETNLDSAFTTFMDRVFLQVIQTIPERGPALFESLFRNAPEDRLERFLSGSTNPIDRLSVMTSLPTLPFLRAALAPA